MGCSQTSRLHPYLIGRDASWYPLNLAPFAANMTAFSTTLFQEIGAISSINFHIQDNAASNLVPLLTDHVYQGIISYLEPTLQTREPFSFSEPFVHLGPVFVTSIDSSLQALSEISCAAIGVEQTDGNSVLLVQKEAPSAIIKLYEDGPSTLEALVQGEVEGVLLAAWTAYSLIPATYPTLKISSPPLTKMGLRLITLKGKNEKLIKAFNKGLKKIQEEGIYDALRAHFSIPQSPKPSST